MTITLTRHTKTDLSTISTISDESGKVICSALELPWKNNMRQKSCIPPGEYDLEFLPNGSPKFSYPCFLVKGVQGRSGIMIHRGNYPKDTIGCILPGMKAGKDTVQESTAALTKLVNLKPSKIIIC